MVDFQMDGVPAGLNIFSKISLKFVSSVVKDFGDDVWAFPVGPKLAFSNFFCMLEYLS